jgi:glycosyltransferase involved in cell wall biosynthesis
MQNLLIRNLPDPPPGKTGWPWTCDMLSEPDDMLDEFPWPTISVVSPSYNQAPYLEETIRSVLLQNYPGLEYIIIDGGSTDGSVEILQRYADHLTYWVSEKDQGQADAINKGWQRATGEILSWINSDDTYCPGALKSALAYFVDNPIIDMIYGDCYCIDEESTMLGELRSWQFDLRRQLTGRNLIHQSSTFYYRSVIEQLDGLDPSFHYVMDYDLWVRMLLAGFQLKHIPYIFSNYRLHGSAKTVADRLPMRREVKKILYKIYDSKDTPRNILKWRRRAFSTYYRSIGDAYYLAGQNTDARKAYWRALKSKPLRLTSMIVFFYLIDTYLGTSLGPFLQNLRWRLPDVPKDDLMLIELITGSDEL